MLLETLFQSELLNNTMIALTGDHGEEFREHYSMSTANHGHSAYDELLHVPLILVLPDTEFKQQVVEDQVRLTDIFPTILLPVTGGSLGGSRGSHHMRSSSPLLNSR